MLMVCIYKGRVARERRHIEVCEQRCTLGEFITANEESLEWQEVIDLVTCGEIFVGGGAAPEFTGVLFNDSASR